MTSITARNGTAVVSWQGGTAPYQLLCRTNATDEWRKVGQPTSAFTATNPLVQGSMCFFMVTTDLTAPAVPTGVRVTTNSCQSLSVTWTAVSDNSGGAGLKSYYLYRNGSLVRKISASTNAAVETGLTAATSYLYAVSAVDLVGNESAKSSVVTAPTPACPGQVPIASAGPDQSNSVGVVVVFNGSNSRDLDGTISSYAWNFGDGTTSSGVSASHTYAAAGTYTVTLTVTDNSGSTASDVALVIIKPAANQIPVANAGPDQTNLVGTTFAFNGSNSRDNDGTIASYSWNFGDNSTGTGAGVSHAYASTGTFTATLTVTDNAGATASDTALIVVKPLANQIPVANAGPDQTNLIGTTFAVSGSNSRDNDGSIVSYAWNFGDNTTGSGVSVSHSYASVGTFTATLTVTDNAGATASDTALIVVKPLANQLPIANAGPDQTNLIGTTFAFSGANSRDNDGSIVSYAWNFGDNTTGSGVSVSHAYASVGTFTTTLTVTDNAGATASDTALIVVKPLANQIPVANAGPDQTNLIGTTFAFSGSNSRDNDGSIVSYAWNFGDNTTGSGVSVSHSYASVGTFTATLTVTDNSGATASDTALIVVKPLSNQLPIADAGADQTSAIGTAVSFGGSNSRDNDGSIVNYAWSFGDGSTGSGLNVSHAYTANGTYSVTLTVTDNAGGLASDTAVVRIGAVPGAGQSISLTSFGGTAEDYGQAVAVDRSGNVYVGGSLTSRPFLAKCSPSYSTLWTLAYFTGVGGGSIRGVAIDSEGNVLITGNFTGTLDFGGGPLTSAGGHDIFVAKYSSAGLYIWAKRFGSASAGGFLTEAGLGIAVDTNNNQIAVTGMFDGPMDIGGGTLGAVADQNIFIAKFSAQGGHLWSKNLAGTGATLGNAVAIDGSGNVIVTGSINAAVDFGAGQITSKGTVDLFVAKYSASGAYLWAKTYGSQTPLPTASAGTALALTRSGDIVVVGEYYFAQSFGGTVLTNANPGYKDIFIAKYSTADGSYVWSKRFGGRSQELVRGVAVHTNGDITVTGHMSPSLDLGGGPLTMTSGQVNIFLANFGGDGSHQWSRSFATGLGEIRAVSTGLNGRPIVAGAFTSTVTIDGKSLTSAGSTDLFVGEFQP